MSILDFVALARIQVTVYHEPHSCSKWIANFNSDYHMVHFKKYESDVILSTCSGWGDTPDLAIQDLCKNINNSDFTVIKVESKGKDYSSRTDQYFGISKNFTYLGEK